MNQTKELYVLVLTQSMRPKKPKRFAFIQPYKRQSDAQFQVSTCKLSKVGHGGLSLSIRVAGRSTTCLLRRCQLAATIVKTTKRVGSPNKVLRQRRGNLQPLYLLFLLHLNLLDASAKFAKADSMKRSRCCGECTGKLQGSKMQG